MIDRATLEAIAYRLKHASGMYSDYDWNCHSDATAQQCREYADLLLDCARSCDDKPKSRDKCDTTSGPCACGAWHHEDDVAPSPDNHPADNQREDEYEPVYATLHFYYNDPDSMRRFRLCNQAEDMKLALWEYDNWLRNKGKYSDGTSDLAFELTRAHLHTVLADHGIVLMEE